jgi:hypothetical protein
MSALSEIDLKDFEKINVDLLEAQLSQDDTTQILLFDFKEYCNTIRRMQKKLLRQTPVLFNPPVVKFTKP